MSDSFDPWRVRLFKIGCGLLGVSILLFIYAWGHVSKIHPLQAELEAGLRFFRIGFWLNLLAIAFAMFGKGWKRLPFALVALVGISLWYTFTLY
jgi:hypothetical protein